MLFNSTGPHYCPVCPPVMVGRNRDRKSSETALEISESNYSGCGVDMANCPKCGRGFVVSYMVKAITHEPSWDVDPRDN